MKTDIPIKDLPVLDVSDLLALQYRFHQYVHGYLNSGRDPIMFHLADMLLVNTELLARIFRKTELPD